MSVPHPTRAGLAHLLLPSAVALVGLALAPVAGAVSTPHTATSCGLAPAATVSTALGVKAKNPTLVRNGSVLVCYYPVGTNPKAVTVRFETGMNAASFATGRKGFTTNGEPTKMLSGYGSSAYTSVLGAGQYAVSTVVVLKGSTELLVTGTTTLAKVEALAKKILPKL